MPTWNEIKLSKTETSDLGRYGVHVAIVLSLVFSLTTVVMLSKTHGTYFWVNFATCVVPMPIALYFRKRIVDLGVLTYVAALIIALVAAILFV
jgi:hypothetical protein